MNDVAAFGFDGAPVRTELCDGDPWFVAMDVCRILGLGNTPQAVRRLLPTERSISTEYSSYETNGQKLLIVSESGVAMCP